jgi:hypothetical protein
MSNARPFIDDATARQVTELARQGFATALAIANPSRELEIYRLDATTGRSVVVIIDEFSVRSSDYRTQGGGDEGAQRTALAGVIRRFIPTLPDGETIDVSATRLKAGDRFVLPESGPCIVQSVRPDKFGIESGEYILETGSV